jgi:cellulose synthase/poly-beta-1,6-N-acetylglucosamine synthase-like glycosyltransferase
MNSSNEVRLKIIREKPSVVVLTPTTGAPVLEDAIESVLSQDYTGKLHHHIVIDGQENNREYFLRQRIFEKHEKFECIKHTYLYDNVGKNGFYGHRIYAAFPHLLNYDYILFLDQDASYETNHVSMMIDSLIKNNWFFTYSLRKIFDRDGKYVCDDNCESLGEWPIDRYVLFWL